PARNLKITALNENAPLSRFARLNDLERSVRSHLAVVVARGPPLKFKRCFAPDSRFFISGTCLQAEVLDSSKGYVCRLTCSKEYHIPEKPDMISAEQLFPLMKLPLQIKLFTAGNHKKLD
ncbi:hypothetical protein INT45_000381, partial [Circinella minor]